MEHEAPRRKTLSRDDISMDTLPLVKIDVFTFQMRTARLKLPDEEAAELLAEACNAAVQVDRLVRYFRRLDKEHQKRPEDTGLESVWTAVACDLGFLALALRHPRFGPFFPKTRLRLKRKIDHALTYRSRRKPDALWENENTVHSYAELRGAPVPEDSLFGRAVDTTSQLAQFGAKTIFASTHLNDRVTSIEKYMRKHGL